MLESGGFLGKILPNFHEKDDGAGSPVLTIGKRPQSKIGPGCLASANTVLQGTTLKIKVVV